MFKNILHISIRLTAALIALPVLFSVLAPWLALADSFAHFRFHTTLAMALVTLLLLILRDFKTALLGTAVSLIGLAGLSAAFPPATPTAEPDTQTHITLLQLNLSFRNRSPEAVATLIRTEAPDVVTLQEVTQQSGRVITLLDKEYPYRIHCPFATVGGVAVLSRLALAHGEASGCSRGYGLAWLRVTIAGRALSVASLHLHWPYPYGQAAQVEHLRQDLQAIPGPVLLAGDFNAAPWSNTVNRVATATHTHVIGGLRFSFKLKPYRWAPSLGLPIDQVLIPAQLQTLAIKLGPGPGSDHGSIIAKLALQ